jgi:hypothetical protein
MKWAGMVAVVLAAGLAVCLVVISVAVFRTPGHLTAEEATLLSTILGAVVGAIATFLGTHAPSDRGESDTPHMYGIVATPEPTTGTPAPDQVPPAGHDDGAVGGGP